MHTSPEYLKNIPEEYKKALEEEKRTDKIDYDVRDKLYFEGIAEIDWSVGQILDTLKEHNIDKNTFVIFTADNGQARPPHGIGTAFPLSGAKGLTLEGGLRVPTVIRWPSKVKPGSDTDALLTTMDLLPTFAKITGAKLPTDRVLDGKDISACLIEGADSPHDSFFYHRIGKLQAIRSGKWKLHLKGNKLYDLQEDIGEKTNVSKNHPAIIKELKAKVKAFEKDIKANSRPAGKVNNPIPLTK